MNPHIQLASDVVSAANELREFVRYTCLPAKIQCYALNELELVACDMAGAIAALESGACGAAGAALLMSGADRLYRVASRLAFAAHQMMQEGDA